MKITELYIYPIKSLAPASVQRARLRRESVEHDRRFMLLKARPGGGYENVQIGKVPTCALFRQRLDGDEVVVTYHVPSPSVSALRVPLSPGLEGRDVVHVSLDGSPTTAYRMGDPYDAWFTACLGYEVALVYIGDQAREVLAHRPGDHYLWRQQQQQQQGGGWLSGISAYISGAGGGGGGGKGDDRPDQLTFNDIAPFMVASGASLRDVSRRLPEGEEMDIRRFRPNIVVDDDPRRPAGEAELQAWEEDYWGGLSIFRGGAGEGAQVEEYRLALTANCGRCTSINIDYDTGRPAEGEAGSVLKKLMADRRIDDGMKYTPVFGRYAFLAPGDGRDDDGGIEIAVGDEIRVTKRLDYRDSWAWPKY